MRSVHCSHALNTRTGTRTPLTVSIKQHAEWIKVLDEAKKAFALISANLDTDNASVQANVQAVRKLERYTRKRLDNADVLGKSAQK